MQGSKWRIEDAGNNTLAWLNGSTIEKVNGYSWTSLSTENLYVTDLIKSQRV